jgi:hypothetical protein
MYIIGTVSDKKKLKGLTMMDISKAWDLHEQVDATYIDGHTSSVDDDQIIDDETGKMYDEIESVTLWHTELDTDTDNVDWAGDTYSSDEFQRFADTW